MRSGASYEIERAEEIDGRAPGSTGRRESQRHRDTGAGTAMTRDIGQLDLFR
jgi:hypothetical protein